MEIAITVTAVPESTELLLDAAAALQRDLNGKLQFRWLGEGEAMDLILPAEEKTPLPQPSPQGEREQKGSFSPREERQDEGGLSELKEMVREIIGNRPADWCLQASDGRKKRMLIADMDSTIIAQESIDEIAELKGIKAEVAALTGLAMSGELDFESALRERIRLLKGLTPADLQHVLHEHITLNFGARTLVQTMKAHGAHTVLVSGGSTFFTHAIAARAGFAKDRANVFLWDEGHLSGVAEPILGREAKLAALKEEAAAHGVSLSEVIAVGDGANDLDMLKAAGLGVAYRAKPVVAAQAAAQINHTDLAALLYFQGYTRDSFAD